MLEYPKCFEAHLGLGRASVESGAKSAAVEALRKALELKPGDPSALEWLKKAEQLN